MAKKTDSLVLEIQVDDKGSVVVKDFKAKIRGLGKATKESTDKMKSGWSGLWKQMALGQVAFAGVQAGFTMLTSLIRDSVGAYMEQEKADTQLQAVLKSTGNVIGYTVEQLKQMASALQQQTIYGDEVIESAQGLLLTFTNIGKNIFPDALKVILDMNAALGQGPGSLKNVAIQVGKALQDPVLGVTALRRVGVNFSKAQMEVIKKLVETGRVAEAQKMILHELAKEFGGSASAQAKTFAGRIQQLKNAFGDLQEEFIKGLMGTEDFKEAIKKLTDWLQAHQEDVRAFGEDVRDFLDAIKDGIEFLWEFKEALAGVAAIIGMIKFSKLAQNMSSAVDQGAEAMQTKLAGLPAKLGAAAVGWTIGAAIGKGIKKAIDEYAPWINEAMQRYFTYALNLEAVYHSTMKVHATERYKLLKELAVQYGYTGGSVKKMIQTVSKYWDVIKSKLEPSERKHLERLIKTQKELDRVRKAQEKLKKEQIKHNKVIIQTQKTTSSITKAEKQRKKVINDVDKQIREFEKTEDNLNITIDKGIDKFGQLDTTMLDLGKDLPTPQVITFGDKIIDVFEAITEAADKVAEELGKISENMSDMTDLLAKTGLISEESAEGLYQAAEGVGELSQGFSDLSKGNYIGAVIHGIEGVIDVLGGLGKALGLVGDGIQEAIDRERQMIDISDDLAEQIHELAEEIGDTHAATSMYLADAIKEADVTTKTFDNYAKRMHKILSDLDRGNLTAQETTEALGKAWSAMIDKANKLFDGKITAEMLNTIRDVKNRGLEVAEITEYIFNQLSTGVKALTTYWQNLSGSQKDYNRAVQYTLSFYNALQQEGRSLAEIMSIMGGAFDEALKKMEEGGYNATGAFKELLELRKKITEHQGLIDSINAAAKMLETLGNSAYLTKKDFMSFQNDAISQFKKLKEAGFSNKEALMALQPMLENLLWYSEQYGYELDDQTKKLIEQAQAQGLLKEKTMPFQEKTVVLLEEIVKLLGGDIPYALNDLTKQADKNLGKMINRTKEWGRNLRGIANVNWNNNFGGYNMPAFATGGEFWVNKPTPILVGEGGEPEHVVITPKSKYLSGIQKSGDVSIQQTLNFSFAGVNDEDRIVEVITRAIKNNNRGLVNKIREVIN